MVIKRNRKRIQDALSKCGLDDALQSIAKSSSVTRFLGLDINTNSTGFAVLNDQGKLLQWGHVDTKKIPSEDVLAASNTIQQELVDTLQPNAQSKSWLVGIEDFMRQYTAGKFQTRGLFHLAQINGIVGFACWQRFGRKPVHTHPTAARSALGISNGGVVKEQVYDLVARQEPEAVVSLPRTKAGRLTDTAFDMTDAYVIAAYTRFLHLQQGLVDSPELVESFHTTYFQMSQETKLRSNKPSAEAQQLRSMTPTERKQELYRLYCSGVDEWMKNKLKQDLGL